MSRLSRSITFLVLVAVLAFSIAAYGGSEESGAAASEDESSEATAAEETSAQPTATATSTASPTATPTPSASSASPTPAPSSTTPAPVETTPPPDVPADLAVESRNSGLLAQLGGTVDYVVVVTNRGAETLRGVTITNDVPAELDVAGVPVIDAADTINLITVGSNEQIVWGINALAPGQSVRLPWFAQVVKLGDFAATNSVIATVPRKTVTATSDVYLAAPGSTRVDDGRPVKVKPRTITRRTVTYESRRVATAPDAQAAPGTLPATGVAPLGWVLLGVVILVVGLLLVVLFRPGGDRRRILLALVAGLVTLAACVSGGPDATDSAEDPRSVTEKDANVAAGTEVTPSDEVLGTRVDRDDDASDEGTGNPDQTDDDDGVADNDGDGPVAADDDDGDLTEGSFIVETVPVETFEVVRIAPEPAPVVPLGSLTGANTMNFEWDEPSRTMASGSSGIIIGDDPASLTTSLSAEQGPIGMAATIRNDSETDRLAVRGRIALQISGTSGSARLTSAPIDVVLEPGGEVTTPFSFLLPSGSYSATAVFLPS